MKTNIIAWAMVIIMPVLFIQCNNTPPAGSPGGCDTCRSYAVFAEFARDSNKLMQNGLNRRMYNITEKIHGKDIALQSDGSINLQPGTYHISGFSMVTMQASMVSTYETEKYPGYCLVYPAKYNDGKEVLQNQLCIGSAATSDETTPSIFDFIYNCDTATSIAVGHQSGNDLPAGKIYMSVYKVDTTTSDYHVFSRIAITKMY